MSHKTLYHVTPRTSLFGILTVGLDPLLARGRMQAVWLCSRAKLAWAKHHVAEHHQRPLRDMAILKIDAHRLSLRRVGRKGIYLCGQVISPSRVIEVYL